MNERRRVKMYLLDVIQRLLSGSQTVGAAFGVFDGAGKLLMVRSRHARGWGLPAGYRRRGESIAQTACRELVEETGVVPAPGYELRSVVFETSPAHVTAVFQGRLGSRDTVRPSWLKRLEIREAAWFTTEQIAGLELRDGTSALLTQLSVPYPTYLPE